MPRRSVSSVWRWRECSFARSIRRSGLLALQGALLGVAAAAAALVGDAVAGVGRLRRRRRGQSGRDPGFLLHVLRLNRRSSGRSRSSSRSDRVSPCRRAHPARVYAVRTVHERIAWRVRCPGRAAGRARLLLLGLFTMVIAEEGADPGDRPGDDGERSLPGGDRGDARSPVRGRVRRRDGCADRRRDHGTRDPRDQSPASARPTSTACSR